MALPQKTIDSTKVAIYIRWSTDDQADGTTMETQLEGCRHYVLSQGWQMNDDLVFVDEGYSGGNLERPALTKLRSLIKRGKVDCVVVFKVDRLSRSVTDTVKLVLDEWDGRTYLKSAREAIDTTNAMGKQFFYMLVSYAEWERSVIRERTVTGRRQRAQEGYKPSAVRAYGYRHSPKRKGAFEIVQEEAAVVKRIFRLYNTGSGAQAIVNALNEDGLTSRDGKAWNQRTVLHMLSNRIYVGDMVYGRLTRNPRHGKEEGETYWLVNDQPMVVQDSPYIPAIISREDFALAQEGKKKRALKAGNPSGRANSSPYLLTGIGKCKCGYGLWSRKYEGYRNKKYGYYGCIGKKIKGPTACDSGQIPQPALDAEIERQVMAEFGTKLAQERYLQQIVTTQQQKAKEVEAEMALVDRQVAALQEQEKKIRRDYRTDLLSITEYRQMQGELHQELQDLRERRGALEEQYQHLQESKTDYHQLQAGFEQIKRWDTLDVIQKKHVLRQFIKTLTVFRGQRTGVLEIDVEWVSPIGI